MDPTKAVNDGIGNELEAFLDRPSFRIQEGSRIRVVEGEREGVRLTVEYRIVRFWSVRAKGKAPPILAELRPRRLGEGHAIARGAIEDVGTGDAELDQGWLLEGAPRDTLRAIFDGPVCKKVLAVGTFALGIDDGTITASVNGSGSSDALTIKAAIDLVVALRKNLDRLEPPSDAARRDAAAAIDALRAKRERFWARQSLPTLVVTSVALAVLVVGLAAGLFYGCGIDGLLR